MIATRRVRQERIALAIVIIAAAAIRIISAGYPLWFDEVASTTFAAQPVARLWSGWMLRESNPPLYYTLLRAWTAALGGGDVTARLLSVAIDLAGIVIAWGIARRLGGPLAGLAAAALLAVSAANVDVAQSVRGYALAFSASLAATWCLIEFVETRRPAALIGYAAAAAAALYAHTTMIAFVLLSAPWLLWAVRRDRTAWVGGLVATGSILPAWSWWAWISIRQAQKPHSNFGWITRPTPGDGWGIVRQAYLPDYLFSAGAGADLLLALLIGVILWIAWIDRRPAIRLLAILSLGTPLLLFAVSQVVPIMLVRTIYWASGPTTILVAVAIARLRTPYLSAVALSVLLLFEAAALVHWLPARSLERWPTAMRAIHRLAPHGGTLLVEGDAPALAAARYAALAPGVRIVALNQPVAHFDHWADGLYPGPHVDAAGAQALLRHDRKVIVLVRGDHDPGRALAGAGAGHAYPALTDRRQPFLWIWSSAAEPPQPLATSLTVPANSSKSRASRKSL